MVGFLFIQFLSKWLKDNNWFSKQYLRTFALANSNNERGPSGRTFSPPPLITAICYVRRSIRKQNHTTKKKGINQVMAKQLDIRINGRSFYVTPIKLERKKVYGWNELRVVTPDGDLCQQAGLNSDGITKVVSWLCCSNGQRSSQTVLCS